MVELEVMVNRSLALCGALSGVKMDFTFSILSLIASPFGLAKMVSRIRLIARLDRQRQESGNRGGSQAVALLPTYRVFPPGHHTS